MNSGLFIGYATEIWKLLNMNEIEDGGDDQLYYTQLYLNQNIRVIQKSAYIIHMFSTVIETFLKIDCIFSIVLADIFENDTRLNGITFSKFKWRL